MTGTVGMEIAGQVATITLDRPDKLNAVTREMARELDAIVARCNSGDEVRCAILTGAGERAFCAGSDIRALDEFDDLWSLRNREDYCAAIRRLRRPVIAAINGYALGGGLEMAMGCDIRLAAEGARLGAPEIKLGWIGGGGMASLLSRSAGASNAALMLMTGEPVEARRAAEWGLVSEVTAPEALLDRAREIAAAIAARAPIAAEHAKMNLDAAANMPARMAMQYELDLQAVAFATEDAAEGRRAFAEKRAPVFRRR